MSDNGDNDDFVFKRVEGWIYKKGGAVKGSALAAMKNWKKRYFYLENVGSAQKLYEMKYYDKPRGSLKGTVKLKGTEVYCDNTHLGNTKNKKFEFQILLSNGSMLKLYCDVLSEREEWVETLNYVITEMKVKPVQQPAERVSLKNATFTQVCANLSCHLISASLTFRINSSHRWWSCWLITLRMKTRKQTSRCVGRKSFQY